jgi:hypothetical protein
MPSTCGIVLVFKSSNFKSLMSKGIAIARIKNKLKIKRLII